MKRARESLLLTFSLVTGNSQFRQEAVLITPPFAFYRPSLRSTRRLIADCYCWLCPKARTRLFRSMKNFQWRVLLEEVGCLLWSKCSPQRDRRKQPSLRMFVQNFCLSKELPLRKRRLWNYSKSRSLGLT